MQENGFKEGLEEGKQRGYEEGHELGREEGTKLGKQLGHYAAHLFLLCEKRFTCLALERKTKKVLQEILEYPLDNREDPDKEHRLIRIHGACRELSVLLNLPELIRLSRIEDLKNFDF